MVAGKCFMFNIAGRFCMLQWLQCSEIQAYPKDSATVNLVGGIPTPLQKYDFVSWDDESPNIYGKIKYPIYVPKHQPETKYQTRSEPKHHLTAVSNAGRSRWFLSAPACRRDPKGSEGPGLNCVQLRPQAQHIEIPSGMPGDIGYIIYIYVYIHTIYICSMYPMSISGWGLMKLCIWMHHVYIYNSCSP